MKTTTIAILLGLTGAVCAAQPTAHEHRESVPRIGQPVAEGAARAEPFKELTRAEAIRKAGEQFDRIDLNKDGVISREEMKAAHAAMRRFHMEAPGARPGQAPGASAPRPAPSDR